MGVPNSSGSSLSPGPSSPSKCREDQPTNHGEDITTASFTDPSTTFCSRLKNFIITLDVWRHKKQSFRRKKYEYKNMHLGNIFSYKKPSLIYSSYTNLYHTFSFIHQPG